MTVMEPAVQQLISSLGATLNPDAATRKQAEAFLKNLSTQPGYSGSLLQVSTANEVELNTRLSAAVNFKNHVKYHWKSAEDSLSNFVIPDNEKDAIKQTLVTAMLSTQALIQSQLSEALALICESDFPDKWPTLLPELVQRLNTQDYAMINSVLISANAIFKHFRTAFRSDELYTEMKYVLELFAQPLLELLKRTSPLVAANAGNAEVLKPLLTCITLISRIFFSLNSQELPEFFEDTMAEWFNEYHNYLEYENPLLVESDPDKESVVTQLKTSICENVNMYIQKNEEEFEPFLQTFVGDVWKLLVKVGAGAGTDRLAANGIGILTSVGRGVFDKLFGDEGTLKQMVEGIIIPNLQVREEDEELFETNFVEYIRRDIEGSDSDTRRRVACEFLKVLVLKFEAQVTPLVAGHVNTLLAQYAADPANGWKAKDCAMYLVVALAVKTQSSAKGATEVNTLVDISTFFTTHVQPEITAPIANGSEFLKADALKFITTFRNQLPKETFLGLLPSLIQLLGHDSSVVHSYAAHAIERTLVVSDGGVKRFQAADIGPFLQPLLGALFAAFQLGDSEENEYLMKCVMRVIAVMGKDIKPFANTCQAQIMNMLSEVAKNPRNPIFNHYVFETVAALVRNSNMEENETATTFEGLLFPPFQTILQMDVVEFAPYVFQILSQVLETRPLPLPPAYVALLPALLSPVLWERSSNVVSLIRLLQAYLKKAPEAVTQQLQGLLGVVQKLISTKAHDHEGFYILNSLIEYLPLQVLDQYMPALWGMLFTRLTTHKTPKLCRSMTVFVSLFSVRHGLGAVNDSIDKVSPGLFRMVLEQVMLSTLPIVSGPEDRKLCAVALTRVLAEYPAARQDPALCAKLLDGLVGLFEKEEEDAGDNEEEELAATVDGTVGAASQLSHATKQEDDPVPDVKDARVHLAQTLATVSASAPGQFGGILQQLPPASQTAIAGYCQAAGVAIA